MSAAVHYAKDGGRATITLDRPEALNALNLVMRDALWEALLAVRDDPDVRVVVLRGAGERAFCAGADIAEFGSAPSLEAARRSRAERDVWGLLASLEQPLIAALHGWALGAGCEIALFCDLRIAATDTRLGLPEVRLGYIPSAGGTQTLPRLLRAGDAARLLLSGEPVGAEEALRLGLVHRVVPPARLDAEVTALAETIAARPPAVVRALLRILWGGADLPLAEALALEARAVRRAGLAMERVDAAG